MVRDCSNVKSRLLPRYISRESGSNYSRKAFTSWLTRGVTNYAHIVDKTKGYNSNDSVSNCETRNFKAAKIDKKRLEKKQFMYGKYDNWIKKNNAGLGQEDFHKKMIPPPFASSVQLC